MNFLVFWNPVAENELAALWLDSTERDAITRASFLMERRLESDAGNQGESRPEGRRILFEPPLGVYYRVHPDQRLVRVLHVWHYRKHGPGN